MNSLFLFLAPSTRKLDHTVLDQLTQPTGHKENSKRKNKEETLVGKLWITCENFSMLICRKHVNLSQTVLKVEIEYKKLTSNSLTSDYQYKLQVDKCYSHSPQSHTWGAIKNAKKSSLFIM